MRCDVTPQEAAPPSRRGELSCGLRKLVEEEDKRRKKAEENVFR